MHSVQCLFYVVVRAELPYTAGNVYSGFVAVVHRCCFLFITNWCCISMAANFTLYTLITHLPVITHLPCPLSITRECHPHKALSTLPEDDKKKLRPKFDVYECLLLVTKTKLKQFYLMFGING